MKEKKKTGWLGFLLDRGQKQNSFPRPKFDELELMINARAGSKRYIGDNSRA